MNSVKKIGSAALVILSFSALISTAEARPNSRFWVGDADTGRVVYDDGRDDGGCIFRRAFAGYDWSGRPIYRKVFRCF
jgi:hypothetical protein